jgi:hypothetical protein
LGMSAICTANSKPRPYSEGLLLDFSEMLKLTLGWLSMQG